MPATIPTRDQLATFPPAISDALVLAGTGVLHGTLTFPVAFGTADAAVLYTVPAGYRMAIIEAFWEVTVSFTGGAVSTIGLSSSNAGFNTKGDLLGGAAGDAAAVVISTGVLAKGAVGAKMGAPNRVVLIAADTIRFDRITSAFAAGSGFAHVSYRLIPTA